jgi:DNA-directed RNA polymerase subunit RPC12/RpoP
MSSIVTCYWCGKSCDKNNSDSSGIVCDNCGYLLPVEDDD